VCGADFTVFMCRLSRNSGSLRLLEHLGLVLSYTRIALHFSFIKLDHSRCTPSYVTIITEFNVHGSVHRNNILIYIQQDAALHSLFYLEIALHVAGGTTIHHQECKQLYLQHLVFVTLLLLPAAIAERSRCCRYSCLRS